MSLTHFHFLDPDSANRAVTIGISGCLMGEPVRYDGEHKAQSRLIALAGRCKFVTYCPEAAAGLGIPRPPIELVETARGVRVLGVASPNRDVTDALRSASLVHCETLEALVPRGYILKARSPSCGPGDSPVVIGNTLTTGFGLFAHTLRETFPGLLLVSEAQLDSTARAESFLRLCQLAEECAHWPSQDFGRWHEHYCAELNLPAALIEPGLGRDAYWAVLGNWLSARLQATMV